MPGDAFDRVPARVSDEEGVTKMARQIDWGFNGLGEIVALRTYARILPDGRRETWEQVIERVIKGTHEIDAHLTQAEETSLAEHMFALRGSVSGRALWQLGTPMVARYGSDSLTNCLATSISKPSDLTWIMDRLMVGGGVGFSVERANIYQLSAIKGAEVRHERTSDADFIVPDKREGWSELIRRVITAYFEGQGFTYSTLLIRPAGATLVTFGGTASGPIALIDGVTDICRVMDARIGKRLRSIDVLDIANIIGRIVVAGSARRSAQISLGDPDDALFFRAKRWDLGNVPAWRANSNNTIVADGFDEIPDGFWKTFTSDGGEVMGLFNRKLSREIGRLGEKRPDPSIVGVNPCFAGDTRFLTIDGWRTFAELDGGDPQIVQDARVIGHLVDGSEQWIIDPSENGTVTSQASRVRITGHARQLYRLTTSDGRTVRATDDHHFATPTGMVMLRDLTVGDEMLVALPDPYVPDQTSPDHELGYLVGLAVSDGRLDPGIELAIEIRGREDDLETEVDRLSLLIERAVIAAAKKDTAVLASVGPRPAMTAPAWVRDTPTEGGVEYRVMASTALGRLAATRGWAKDDLAWLHRESRDFKAGFISGFAYGDGSVQDSHGSLGFRFSQSVREPLSTLQLVLQELGVRASLLFRRPAGEESMPDGHGGRRAYPYLPNYELIVSGRYQNRRLGLVMAIPPHLSSRWGMLLDRYTKTVHRDPDVTRVARIEADAIEDVWCLSEDTRRTLVAEGLTARRCGEIPLADKETCNLAEIFLPRIESYEQIRDLAGILYKFQKAVAMLPHPSTETEAIVHQNVRLGLSVSGILSATQEQRDWLDPLYRDIRALDREWSRERGLHESVRLTTVKPSGSLSLLSGVTPGIHPAYAQRYIRRVRFGSIDPLVDVCRRRGYPVFTDVGLDGAPDHSRLVVEFPCEVPDGTLLISDVSAIDQLEWVRWAQQKWSDNAVSVTVSYHDSEVPAIRAWLHEHYDRDVKSVSFLRYSDHGFALAPYEPIDEREYDRRVRAINPLTGPLTIIGTSDLDDGECATGACPVR